MHVDVDGDGCPSAVVQVGNVVEIGSDRFVIGKASDEIVLGDWDCDGAVTPAVYRSATRQLVVHNAWPGAGGVAPPGDISSAPRRPDPPDCAAVR